MDLRETQERLRDEREDRRFCHRKADSLQVTLGGFTRSARSLASVDHRLRTRDEGSGEDAGAGQRKTTR